ncbi:MAG: hypothetical protein QMC67_02475 [Candidatus Wallbacteria bacterium]
MAFIRNTLQKHNTLALIISISAMFLIQAFFSEKACAYPFTEENRLDMNSADEFDFMDIYELDMLSAERIVKFRNENGPFSKEEDLLKFMPEDAFLDVLESIEIGTFRAPNLNGYSGNSYSDFTMDVDKKNSMTSHGRYNFNFGDTVDLRFAFGKDTAESNLKLTEKHLNYYFYTDSYLKKDYVIESSPAVKKVKVQTKKDEEIQKNDFEYLDNYFSQKVMVGRKKRKKIQGLYETNLDEANKYILVKKKKPKEAEEEPADEAEKPAEETKAKTDKAAKPEDNLVKDVKLDIPDYNKNRNMTSEIDVKRRMSDTKYISSVLTIGDVMVPQGKFPLIPLHRTENSGLKFKKYFQNFDFTAIGTKASERDTERLGGSLNFYLQDNTRLGARVEKLWNNDRNQQTDYVHLYGAGKLENINVYGEMQSVFNGADSVFAEAMSKFNNVSVTTRILSVKENYTNFTQGQPYSFDGQFTTFLRMNYNFSNISSFAASYQESDMKRNDPDEDYGKYKISKFRFLLYPTVKTRILMTYADEKDPLDIANNIFSTSVRYAYKPKISLIGKFYIKDNDINTSAGRNSETSLEWQRRVKDNLKIILKYSNLWDESKLNTPEEFTNLFKIGYYRNF